MSTTGAEGGFPFIVGSDSKLIVGVLHTETGVVLRMLETIEQLGDERERITIFDSEGIELSIIDD